MTLLNAMLQLTHFKSPFLRTLLPCVGAAYAIQAGVAIPSILAQSERFYDLSGSLTYVSIANCTIPEEIAHGRAVITISVWNTEVHNS